MEGGVKQISVTLTPEDVKAISRSKTRKRKAEGSEDYIPARRRKVKGGASEELAIERENIAIEIPETPLEVKVPEEKPNTVIPIPFVPQAQTQTQVPNTVISMEGGVKIQTRKRTHNPTGPVQTPSVAARILPIKRFAPVGAKPKLMIPSKTMKVKHTKPVDVKTEVKPKETKAVESKPEDKPKEAKPEVKEKPKKRRFTERRLSISVETVVKTRKHRKTVKVDVDSMPLEEIRAKLIAKGILRKSAKVPDSMLRSMMKDLLLLNMPE